MIEWSAKLFTALLILTAALRTPIQAEPQAEPQVKSADSCVSPDSISGQDAGVGSAMTLEQLRQGKLQAQAVPQPIPVVPAAEPVPALRYRLYPTGWEKRPGSALLHFCRAQMFFQQLPRDKQLGLQNWANGVTDPSEEELKTAVETLQAVFHELHLLALSESFSWDHRIRDLRGPDIYSYMLPDVQEARSMARLLRLKIQLQLRLRDLEGACSSISDGLRLAEFVGQGETLIQKIVGVAISSIIFEAVEDAIGTPGCPNLYWALASIPQPLIDIRQSALWELQNIPNVLPALAEAETANWSGDQAKEKWGSLMKNLSALEPPENVHERQVVLAAASVTGVDMAMQRLRAGGVGDEQLEAMAPLHIVMMDAARELREIGDRLGKAQLLPAHLARPLLVRHETEFHEWSRQNRLSSISAVIGEVLVSPGRQARDAEIRMLLRQNRLMTLEALRMFASEHDGQWPDSLDQLTSLPPMPDPYTNGPFAYRVETVDGQSTMVLTAAGPDNYKPLQELRARLVE